MIDTVVKAKIWVIQIQIYSISEIKIVLADTFHLDFRWQLNSLAFAKFEEDDLYRFHKIACSTGVV
jgi:hypothetical protein